jgi:hypothetical protein
MDTAKALQDPPLLILCRMPSTLRSASLPLRLCGSASRGATALTTPRKIRGAASRAGRGGMGCYNKAVLRQHLLLSMVPYGIILRRCLLPPCPCLFLCCLPSLSAVRRTSSATHHSLPAFVPKFAAQSRGLLLSSTPALVALFTLPALQHCPCRCCRDTPVQKL